MRRFARFLLFSIVLLLGGMFGAPAFGQCAPPPNVDVNADRMVNASDALILYYSYSLRSSLGTGRGDGSSGGGVTQGVSIAAEMSSVVEGSPAVFVLTADAPAQTAFTVDLTVTATGEFEAATGMESVEFGANETTATLSIETTGDGVDETDGTVTATIQCDDGPATGEEATASVAILDDDVTISIAAQASAVLEGSPAVFVLTGSKAARSAFTVDVGVAGGGQYSVATTTWMVAFEVDDATATLSVPTVGDDAIGEPATVTATVNSGTGYLVGQPATARVVISNDDVHDEVGASFRECAGCPEIVIVPSGMFEMGAPEGEDGSSSRERPVHTVTIPDNFAVGKYEVTFAEWDACVSDGGCPVDPVDHAGLPEPRDQGWGRGTRPVIDVSWENAQEYVAWLKRKTGRNYRLLSESEWEYAARAGATSTRPWGDDIGVGNANCEGCGGAWDPPSEGERRTAPVGSYPANAFGLHDMLGNAAEWVEDCGNRNYNGAPTNGSAWDTGSACGNRVYRGGSWDDGPDRIRSASRIWGNMRRTNETFGFRVARDLD